MKEITLPSGRVAKIDMATFSDGRALYQAVLKELKDIDVQDNTEIDVNFFKGIFCSLLSSRAVEDAIWKCFFRVVYDNSRITMESFEKEENRSDYLILCYEVAWYNIAPFTKGLYAKLSPLLDQIGKLTKNLS